MPTGISSSTPVRNPLERGNRPVAPRERVVVAEDIRILPDAHVAALVLRIAVKNRGELFARHVVVRAVSAIAVAEDDVMGRRPFDAVDVPTVLSSSVQKAYPARIS